MPAIETVYVIHHSHMDVGFTNDPPIVWELYRRFIDLAIDACERGLDDPKDCAIRWTVETTAHLLTWLESASDRQIARFQELERLGRIEATGLYAHLSPLADPPAYIESLQPLSRLREEYGLTIRHAMDNDINGNNWPLCDLMLDAGMTGFTMGINEHAGGAPTPRPNLFLWEAPSGRRLPTLNGWNYGLGGQAGVVDCDLEKFEKSWETLARQLAQADWMLPVTLIQATFPICDNGAPDPNVARFVRRWNAEGRTPHIRLATPRDWWVAVEPYLDRLPVWRGDWTDYWNFGAISSAREVTIGRSSAVRLNTADQLAAWRGPLVARSAGRQPTRDRDPAELYRTAPALREDAWRSLILWDEHTWGADNSISSPESEDAQTQWNHKAHLAYRARSLSLLLQRDAVAELALAIPRRPDDAVVVYNPLPWPRTVNAPIEDVVRWPFGRAGDPSATRHHQDRAYGHPPKHWLRSVTVPGCGYAVATSADVVSQERPDSRSELVVENTRHRLSFDGERGGIVSWFDKELVRELVDPDVPWRFGAAVRETVDSPSPSRRDIYSAPQWTVEGHGRAWIPGWPARRCSAERVLCHEVLRTPAGIEVIQRTEVAGLASPATIRYILSDDSGALEIRSAWIMGQGTDPEATYIAMPFAMASPIACIDIGGQAIMVDRDQIPGCCRDYFTSQRWVDFTGDDWGVTVACHENPLVQLGDFHFSDGQRAIHLERAMLLGWVTNNYWEVNFRAHQPGAVAARYTILPHAGPFDESAAHRFGAEAAVPVVLQSTFEEPRPGVFLPRTASLLALPEPPVLVQLVVADPSNPGSVAIHLVNASDAPADAVLGSGLLTITAASVCNLFRVPVRDLPVTDGHVRLSLAPRETAVVRPAVAAV